MVLAIISLCVLVAYVAATCLVVKGVPTSVSDTFYHLKNGWLFTIILWIVAFTLLPTWLEVGNENFQFLVFLSCMGLAFVGASPHFKTYEHKIHVCSTAVCGASAMVWVALHVPLLLLLWVPWVAAFMVSRIKHKESHAWRLLFWAEITAFAITNSAIFIA